MSFLFNYIQGLPRLILEGRQLRPDRVWNRACAGRGHGTKRDFREGQQGRHRGCRPFVIHLGYTKRWSQGLVNFVSALAYHFCLALHAAFTQPGVHLLSSRPVDCPSPT